MGFDHRRTVTYRLAQAAHAYRVRAGSRLARIELHSGQESLLKALGDNDGQSMSDLAATLGVQPPTVTKMISRLAAQDYVERRASKGDGRQAMVFLTERGKRTIEGIDKVWKRIEKDAVSGIDDKDRKQAPQAPPPDRAQPRRPRERRRSRARPRRGSRRSRPSSCGRFR